MASRHRFHPSMEELATTMGIPSRDSGDSPSDICCNLPPEKDGRTRIGSKGSTACTCHYTLLRRGCVQAPQKRHDYQTVRMNTPSELRVPCRQCLVEEGR